MKKYYFKRNDNNSRLIEECNVLNDGTCIGSATCTECEFCFSYNTLSSNNMPWIKCNKINEATNNYYDIY